MPHDVEIEIDEPGVFVEEAIDFHEEIAIEQPELAVTDVTPLCEALEICAPGPKGDPGDAFPGTGDKTYHHVQSVPSMNVTVVHGLNKFPAVTVKDTLGNQVETSVTFIDNNTVSIQLSAPFAWTADFN